MTTEQNVAVTSLTAESIESALIEFLADKVKADVAADLDLFGSGLVSSMFAMQLVVHVESTYDIAIIGPELTARQLPDGPGHGRLGAPAPRRLGHKHVDVQAIISHS